MDTSGRGGSDGLVGRTVGNYQVLARIGQGGMGAVYLAHHAVLGRKAAVKVLLPEYSNNPDLIGRFFQEARATAQLRHRGFVEVFDSGNLPDGSAYLVMQYLRGANLAACIEHRRSLPVDACFTILRDVAASVGFAHRHGIVHRDLKPDNVFLSVDRDEASGDDQVTVKVLDFGIAKLTTATPAPDGSQSARTRTGLLLGTPLFMSPEQCRGAGKVDHRSDIYSLGCIAYNMLTGKPPFSYEGFGEIIAAHINQPPTPLRAVDPRLPEAVDSLVLRMLAKGADDRPDTMEAVMAAIDQLRSTVPETRGGQDLLALVPPQPPELAMPPVARSPSGGARSGSNPSSPPFGATTPFPGSASAVTQTPSWSGKSGGTKLLPSEPGTRPGGPGTLSGVASEIGAPGWGREPRRRGRGLVVTLALVAAAGVAAGAYFFLVRDDGRPARGRSAAVERERPAPPAATRAEPPTPPPARREPPPADDDRGATVVVRIVSTPDGAAVVEMRGGKTLGVTPFAASFPRASGQVRFILRKQGYRPKELTLKMAEDADLSVALDRKAAAPSNEPNDDRRKL